MWIRDRYKWIQVGKLVYSDQNKIGTGCQGTAVFSGEFDGRKVAIKRLLKAKGETADKERALLLQADDHRHIVRYFCLEDDDTFVVGDNDSESEYESEKDTKKWSCSGLPMDDEEWSSCEDTDESDYDSDDLYEDD